ncbi:uncharacterized protein LOC126892728 [Diabrotica virgifera virgifera]|uniref:Peptidase A2 domain-containing protein n=1 Tax=Diabrotica virgifera virgifera TaxID=50390 RepID=A0ABM5L7A6_DIAVI|nr:uncharacterized protein LOC126892728 [Diabrotica virgifera virgifera]
MNDHIVPVTELCFDGNMRDNWSFFEQKFNIFLEASKLNEETDSLQGSVLLNRVGDRALRIYNNFEWSSDEKKTSCKAILKKFKEYFTPSKNVTYERYLFFTRDKMGLETYDSYVTELRQLASTCEFDTLTDSLIRDRLILGISDVSLKDRLLREQGLTLSRGLEICRAAEVAARQLSVISGANSSQSLEVLEIQKQKKHQSNRNQQPKSAPQYTADPGQSYRNHPQTSGNQKISNNFIKNCYKCGSNHSLNKCPAYGLRCKICNKFNHFAKVCNANSYRNRVHNVNVHQSDTDSDSDFSPDQFFLNNINEKSSEKWYEDCFINNKIIVSFRLDSGADCCVLPYTYFKKLNIQTSELTSSTNKITDYNEKIINTVGSVYLKVRQCKNKENIAKLKFYIVKTHNDAILGLDACIMLNLIQKNNINVINDNLHNDIESISQIIHEYDDAFRGVGCLKGKHTIKIDEKVAPRVHPPRKVPFAMHDKLMEKLKELERLEIIRKVTEPTDWRMLNYYLRKGDVMMTSFRWLAFARNCLFNKVKKREEEGAPLSDVNLNHVFY